MCTQIWAWQCMAHYRTSCYTIVVSRETTMWRRDVPWAGVARCRPSGRATHIGTSHMIMAHTWCPAKFTWQHHTATQILTLRCILHSKLMCISVTFTASSNVEVYRNCRLVKFLLWKACWYSFILTRDIVHGRDWGKDIAPPSRQNRWEFTGSSAQFWDVTATEPSHNLQVPPEPKVSQLLKFH